MNLRDLLDLWALVETSEIPEALAAIQDVRELLESPQYGHVGWWATLADAVLVAADEAVDVTKTDVDDELVAKIAAVRPKVRDVRVAVVALLDELAVQFGA